MSSPRSEGEYLELAAEAGQGWRIPADDSFLAQWGVPEDLRPIVGPRLTDFPLRCATDAVRYDSTALQSVRRAYIRHTEHCSQVWTLIRSSSPAWIRHFDIACGHDAMLDDPDGTVALLREIASQ